MTVVPVLLLLADLLMLAWFYRKVFWHRQASPSIGKGIGAVAAILTAVFLEFLSLTQAVPPLSVMDRMNIIPNHLLRPRQSKKNLIAILDGFSDKGNLIDVLAALDGFSWARRWLDLSNRTLINTEAKPDLLTPFVRDPEQQTTLRKRMIALALPDRRFVKADMSGAQMFSIDLHGADLRQTILQDAQLQAPIFHGPSFRTLTLITYIFKTPFFKRPSFRALTLRARIFLLQLAMPPPVLPR